MKFEEPLDEKYERERERKYEYLIQKRDEQYEVDDSKMFADVEELEVYEEVAERAETEDKKMGVSRKPRKNNFNSNKDIINFISNKFVRFKFKESVLQNREN